MLKKISYIIAIGISMIAINCNKQGNLVDATFLQFDERLKQDPDFAKNYALQENAITSAVKAMNQRGEGALPSEVITIPVVVHIVGNNSDLGVTPEMVEQRIASLTHDFRRENEDELNQVPEAYRWLAADTRIQFKLAKKDANGQPSTGIIYNKDAQQQSFRYAPLGSTPKERNPVKFADTSDANVFPPGKFLRIWVCQLDPALGEGYASLLADLLTRPSEDGIVIDVDYFNGSKAGRNKGRALTNLTAKWLGLKNIWGDTDNVDDTPIQTLPSTGRPTYPRNNGSNSPYGDMFNNFMDATDDDSRVMFTVGQADRIYQAVNLYRTDFQYSSYADELGTPPAFLDYTVKDNAPDDGQEPNPNPGPYSNSPEITVSTMAPPNVTTLPAHEPITIGASMFINVRVTNTTAFNGTPVPTPNLHIYRTMSSIYGASWPSAWTELTPVAGLPVTNVPSAGGVRVYYIPWTPTLRTPGPGDPALSAADCHFCLLARLDNETCSHAPGVCPTGILNYAQNNRHIAWKNVDITESSCLDAIDVDESESLHMSGAYFGNLANKPAMIKISFNADADNESVFKYGKVVVRSKRLVTLWEQGGKKGDGITVQDSQLVILKNGAYLESLAIPPSEINPFSIHFIATDQTPKFRDIYSIYVEQSSNNDGTGYKTEGGQTFIVKAEHSNDLPPAPPVQTPFSWKWVLAALIGIGGIVWWSRMKKTAV